MEIFNLTIDQKATVWERLYVRVEAESLEEAVMKCNNCDYEVDDTEIIYDSMEYMNPSEENPHTFEVYDSNNWGDPLFTNSIYISRNG